MSCFFTHVFFLCLIFLSLFVKNDALSSGPPFGFGSTFGTFGTQPDGRRRRKRVKANVNGKKTCFPNLLQEASLREVKQLLALARVAHGVAVSETEITLRFVNSCCPSLSFFALFLVLNLAKPPGRGNLELPGGNVQVEQMKKTEKQQKQMFLCKLVWRRLRAQGWQRPRLREYVLHA